jgi:hypothetical protein
MTPRNTQSNHKIDLPEIKPLGKWPFAQEAIRQLARDHGIASEQIETLLDEIKRLRADKQKRSTRG